MHIDVDSVITLDNNLNYLVLDKIDQDDETYYLTVRVDDNDELLDENVILKELNENGEKYVVKETNEDKIKELIVLFTKSFNRSVVNLEDLN